MIRIALTFLLLAQIPEVFSQQKLFSRGVNISQGAIRTIVQDKNGFIWFGVQGGSAGLHKYDGKKIISYSHQLNNNNSLANNSVRTLFPDDSGMIWVGTYDGLDRFDPLTETFTHFRHNPMDPASISSDSVISIIADQAGNFWIATRNGLNYLDHKSGKFTRYMHKPGDPESLSNNHTMAIHIDRQNRLWIGTWGGGLNLMDRQTGKFTHYMHNPDDDRSIRSDTITALYEDSKGNFWVGTYYNILHTFDRQAGTFTPYLFDPKQPGKLSGPPSNGIDVDYIPFISEDKIGNIWIGSVNAGLNKYDPLARKITHYGNSVSSIDASSGLTETGIISSFQSVDGLFWFGSSSGTVYTIKPIKKQLPFFRLNTIAVNSFYQEKNGALWIGLQEQLLYRPVNGPDISFTKVPGKENSLSNNVINCIRADDAGNLWLGTAGGGG